MFIVMSREEDLWREDVYTNTICFADTEDKAKEIIKRLESEPYINQEEDGSVVVTYYYEEVGNSCESYIAIQKEAYFDNIRYKITRIEKDLKEYENVLEMLVQVKELFSPLHIERYTSENIYDIFPELHKIIIDNDLPVSLFDGEYDYDKNGKEKCSGRERFTYSIMCIHAEDFGFSYRIGNFNIDDDINRIHVEMSELKAELNLLGNKLLYEQFKEKLKGE